MSATDATPSPRRGRGRPRKHPLTETTESKTSKRDSDDDDIPLSQLARQIAPGTVVKQFAMEQAIENSDPVVEDAPTSDTKLPLFDVAVSPSQPLNMPKPTLTPKSILKKRSAIGEFVNE